MTQKHTPGPLAICGLDPSELLIEPTQGRVHFIAKLPRETGTDALEQVANAEHICACWNACEGINPAEVPEIVEALGKVEARLTSVARAFYVDGTSAALRVALHGWQDDIEHARAALAKAKAV